MIGENTADAVRNDFLMREVDKVKAKGRHQSLRIYELLANSIDELDTSQAKMLRVYADGLAAYRDRRWVEAQQMFEEGLSLWDGDGPCRVMLERCVIYRDGPVAEDWDGVFEHETK